MNLRTVCATIAALTLGAGAASALTITNKGADAITIGVDKGATESVEKIAAGKSLKLDTCQDGCGLTGPWGYSQMAKDGESYVFNDDKLTQSN